MAKYRHRVFEMFDFEDEAVQSLSSKSTRPSAVTTEPVFGPYSFISAVRTGQVTRVGFTVADLNDDAILSDLTSDFNKLTASLENDSQVVIDFRQLNSISAKSIELLALLNRKLIAKGSRVALCNLSPDVQASFFPDRPRS